ncbi:unnamed protein product [Oikopleura dioica]|uniref:Uncharacterized protein n=1 Tax=Oikopleura dioica TaxID=34765 RepID=E4YWJ0_OIKDI|nr:unnamed protein product [Oikopleura dioica]
MITRSTAAPFIQESKLKIKNIYILSVYSQN